jgi:hypothetical protein
MGRNLTGKNFPCQQKFGIVKTPANSVERENKQAIPLGIAWNDCQEMMWRWAGLGGYHAIDVMRLDGPADLARWRRAVDTLLVEHGFSAGAPLATTDDWQAMAQTEMNLPFPSGEGPFRFFSTTGDSSHWCGIVWDHWIADSATIRALMQRLHAHYCGASLPPLVQMPPQPSNSAAGAVSAAWAIYRTHRRSFRLPPGDALDFNTGTWQAELPAGLIDRLHHSAVSCRATVNDVFVAALAQTLGNWTKHRRAQSHRRRDVALGIAVDTRRFSGRCLDDAFTFWLGFFSVVLSSPEDVPLPKLIHGVADQTRPLKQSGAAIRLSAGFRAMRWFWNATRNPWTRALICHRSSPVLAGISNVNMSGSWVQTSPGILDYRRFSPAGPLVPMVFVPTTIGSRLTLTVSWRRSVVSDESAVLLAEDFVGRLIGC